MDLYVLKDQAVSAIIFSHISCSIYLNNKKSNWALLRYINMKDGGSPGKYANHITSMTIQIILIKL